MFPRPLKGSVCPPALHTHTLLCVFAIIGWVCFPIVCRSCSGRTTLAQSVQCSAALLQPVVRQTPALFGDSPASFIPLALPPPVLLVPPPLPIHWSFVQHQGSTCVELFVFLMVLLPVCLLRFFMKYFFCLETLRRDKESVKSPVIFVGQNAGVTNLFEPESYFLVPESCEWTPSLLNSTEITNHLRSCIFLILTLILVKTLIV